MKLSLLLMVLIIGCASVAQQTSDVVKIEFTSLTRGYQETLVITRDSITYTKSGRGEAAIDQAGKLKNEEEWTALMNSLQKVTLSEIPGLKSPTEKRAYDGARHSTITITTKSNQAYSHTFDDEEPHQKLMALMKLLQKKRL
jgi:hypothetical protein